MQAKQDIYFGNPYSQGDKWRGGFGQALRDLTCLTQSRSEDCNHCDKKATCFYFLFFAIDIPHPYIIANDLSITSTMQAGKIFTLQIKLIGFACNELDIVVKAFDKLGKLGIGAKRGRYELISVQSTDICLHDFFTSKPKIDTVVLQLDTPLKLKHDNGELCYGDLNFAFFFNLLLKRIINLNNIYGSGREFQKQAVETEKQALIAKAKEIQSKEATRWVDLVRYSSRQLKRHKIGGIIGSIVFTGMLNGFYPYLKIGEVLHAGLHTTSGFGRYRII